MPTTIDDILCALQACLLAGPLGRETIDDTLVTQIGDNAFADETPDGFDGYKTKGVRVWGGGEKDDYLPTIEGRYTIDCFGGSRQAVDAKTVSRSVIDRFAGSNTIETDEGVIVESHQLGDAVLVEDKENQELFMSVSFQMVIREK